MTGPSSQHDRWRNRRLMAWISLIAGLLYPLLVLVSDSEQISTLASAFYLFITAIVGSYIGFATLDDKWTNDGTK